MSQMDIDVDAAIESQNFGSALMESGRLKRQEEQHPECKKVRISHVSDLYRDDVVSLVDSIDNEVESLRKQAIEFQDKRDRLHTRIEMLRTDFLTSHVDADPDEIQFHLKRITDRLNTVDISVQTHRNHSHIDAMHHINNLIDEIIRFNDPIEKRKKCQEFLNSCTSSSVQYSEQVIFINKQFEDHLLACTLDDQKMIRKRLEALLNYMMKQVRM